MLRSCAEFYGSDPALLHSNYYCKDSTPSLYRWLVSRY